MTPLLVSMTLFVTTAMLSGGLLLAIWSHAGRPTFLALWTGFCGFCGIGGLLVLAGILAPDFVPDATLPVGVNVSMLLGSGLGWAGARQLRGGRVAAWMPALAPALWIAACAVPAFYGNATLRVASGSALYAGLCWAAAAELLRRQQDATPLPLVRALAGFAVLAGVVHLARPWFTAAGMMPLGIALVAFCVATLFMTTAVVGIALAGAQAAAREAAALRAGRAEVERLHGGLPAMLFLRDVQPDGESRRLYWAGDFEAVMGWPEAVLVSHPSMAAFVPAGSPRLVDIMRGALRTGSGSAEWRMRQPDGSFAWMRTRWRLLSLRPDGSGEVAGYTVNVTAERAAEERAMAATRLATLGELATGLAHEMKQPLTAIALAAGIAKRALTQGDLDRAAARLAMVVEQAKRAGAVVEHLRRFGRGAEPEAPPRPIGLDTAVEGALALVGGALSDAAVKVEVALGDPAPMVMGDMVPLEQVLVNLLSNARDAMAARSPDLPRRVLIEATGDVGGMVRLSVADTGGGLPLAVLARLFQPFVSTKGPEHGTGLGLSICRSMVEAMGGTIDAGNGPEGAVFVLRLPMAPEPLAPCPAPLMVAER